MPKKWHNDQTATRKKLTELRRIRERKSYELFSELLSYIRSGNEGAALRAVWRFIDRHKAWMSKEHSYYALESLELLLKDRAQ